MVSKGVEYRSISCLQFHQKWILMFLLTNKNMYLNFEIALYKPIHNHVNHFFIHRQHGFIRIISATTNLFCIIQFIYTAIDNHSQIDVISRIYRSHSTVWNTFELIRKFCVRTSSHLLRTYRRNRAQLVESSGFTSKEFVSTCGVPPGSIFAPLLFNLLINDITNSPKKFTSPPDM